LDFFPRRFIFDGGSSCLFSLRRERLIGSPNPPPFLRKVIESIFSLSERNMGSIGISLLLEPPCAPPSKENDLIRTTPAALHWPPPPPPPPSDRGVFF